MLGERNEGELWASSRPLLRSANVTRLGWRVCVSRQLITEYRSELDRIHAASGSKRERTPRDPTVRARFNTYHFADYKESMIGLLARVVTVSLETVKFMEAMRELDRTSA